MNLIKMAAQTVRRKNPIKVYTDGSSVKRGRRREGGYGILTLFSDGTEERVAGPVKEGTNNQAELTAIKRALQLYPGNYTIYSDSNYSIKALTVWYLNWQRNGWRNARGKEVLNQELIKEILELKEARDIDFKHVKAHQKGFEKGDDFYYNDIADQLANRGRELNKEDVSTGGVSTGGVSSPKQEDRLLGTSSLAASLYPGLYLPIDQIYVYAKKDKFGVIVVLENKQTLEETCSGGDNHYETSLLAIEHVLTKYPGNYTTHINDQIVVKAIPHWLANWKANDWYKKDSYDRVKYYQNWIAIDQLLEEQEITLRYYKSCHGNKYLEKLCYI